MPYRLTMEITSNAAVKQFQREFGSLLDAGRYAYNQVRGDIFCTVREDYPGGLAPEYALRIEATGEDAGKPLTAADEAPAQSDSLFTADGTIEDPR